MATVTMVGAMRVEQISIASLRAYDRNARSHPKKQIRALSKSIETFGFCAPVLIDDDNEIIAGHARVAAATFLGLPSVPAIRLSHLSEEKKRAYIIADNRLSEIASWNKELLASELQGLTDVGFDVEAIGFETAQVDLILEEAREITGALTGPEDEVPALAGFPPPALVTCGCLGSTALCAEMRAMTRLTRCCCRAKRPRLSFRTLPTT